MSTESWAVAAPQTIDVNGVQTVSLRLDSGRAEVVADQDTDQVRVEVLEVGEEPLLVTRAGSSLRLAYERSKVEAFVARVRSLRENARAVVRVTVPAAVSVDVGTVDGDAEVSGTRGTVVKTVTGTVRTVGTTGSLYLRSVSGDVHATDHSGDVSAQVVSGSLTLGGTLGRVSTSTVSGAVTVTAAGSAPLVSAKTVSGAVALRLDDGTPVSLKVRGAAGQVVLDGAVLPSTGRTLVVDHAEPPAEHRAVAYVTATVTSAHVTVSRG
ncbi:DUF4097 family beta strand repeat-containing protein [Isoptericola aurantiacus]|uniref:DUF4097 family beta strand repeat-containing protein n=1 Tax=Isoptericola aurantiacus TaxID=3377839 RepID=UPI00383A2999